jgi:hypothetical protein
MKSVPFQMLRFPIERRIPDIKVRGAAAIVGEQDGSIVEDPSG